MARASPCRLRCCSSRSPRSSAGSSVALLQGYFRGIVDGFSMRMVDLVFAFPPIILAMVVAAVLGRGLQNAALAIVVVAWPSYARVVRGLVLSVGDSEYVESARLLGSSARRTLFRDVLEYPSDLTINGVPFGSLAQRVQSNLQAVGFKIELAGSTVGTWLQKYRDGKMAFGLSLWGPDYPDPADYLAFTPGELVGLRAGWPKGSDPTVERLAAKARVTTATKARQTLYRQIQRRLNATGPFFPLLQPTQVFVSTRDLKNAFFNAQYQVDVTQVSPR